MKKRTASVFTTLLLSCLVACDRQADAPSGVASSPAATGVEPGIAFNPEVVRGDGFGPARFGDNEESVRMAWGRPLVASEPTFGASCYELFSRSERPHGVAFMMEEDEFRRYEVDIPPTIAAHVGPGGVHVGGPVSLLTSQFERVAVARHKYDEELLVYSVEAPMGEPLSQFVVEAKKNGTVTRWRIGRLPQVIYSEGCN